MASLRRLCAAVRGTRTLTRVNKRNDDKPVSMVDLVLPDSKYTHQPVHYSRGIALRTLSTSTEVEKITWSYVSGQTDVPLQGLTIGKSLQQRTEQTPDKQAVVFSEAGIRKIFSELLEASDQFAAGLMELGFKKGDRIGIWGPNSWEWVVTQFATARAGMILVNINPLYRPEELEYALNKVGCKVLVSAEKYRTQDYYEILFNLIPELVSSSPGGVHSHRLPKLSTVVMMGDDHYQGTYKFSDLMSAGTSDKRGAILDIQDKLQFDDPINIQFTSGTTGFPKGSTLSHHNILNNSYHTGRIVGYHLEETRICVPVPLYHCFAMVIGCLQIPAHGACCVFPSPGFEPGLTLQAVQDERCTSLYGVPTMFIDMLNHPEFSTFDLSSLYTGIMAGSPCPMEVMKQVIEKMNMPEVVVCYGTTETSPVTYNGYRDDPVQKKVSTIGHVAAHTEAKVINEAGEVVKVGVPGELCTRGYTTMLGYWEDPDKTAAVISQDRWYHTGDIAEMDEDGYCKIVGRIKDMIIRGGENVYPTDIENCLYKHPQVQDVQVVGVPDERMGEEVCACVRVREGQSVTAEEIRQFCIDKMAKFKVPRYVLFVDSYPLTVTGKIQKFKLREMAVAELGLEHVKPHM